MADQGGPVQVSMVIAARPETIFRYFTDPARFTRWMGQASVLDPEPGGRLQVGYPTGQVAGGTEVRLCHTGLPAGEPPAAHLAGWRHALATLAYAGSADQLGPVLGERVADWLAAWNEPDPVRRAALLGRCVADGGRFRDPTTAVDGVRELADHIGMAQRLTGGARLAGRGDPEPCHGLVRFGWAAVGPDGTVLATGTNVAEADLDGRFRWVTGFWDPPPDRPDPAERS